MSMLKHPLLLEIANQVEQERCVFRWIDLYAAQYIADAFIENQKAIELIDEKILTTSGTTGDLFDQPVDTFVHLNQSDMIVLALICSCVLSRGQTHLNLKKIPQDLIASAKLCGYQPSFSHPETLIKCLANLDQVDILQVVAHDEKQSEDTIPLKHELTDRQAPLVLFKDKLYLAKYWALHQAFENWLQSRSDRIEHLDSRLVSDLSNTLKAVFSMADDKQDDAVNWQAVSAAHTLINPFSVITGGPGTGKTTTAASLLFMLMHKRQLQAAKQKHALVNAANNMPVLSEKLYVRLLAPTGKAAVKLADSIRFQLQQIETRMLGSDIGVLRMSECLPETGETVHRFLYEMGGLRDAYQGPKRFKGDEVLIKRSQVDVQISKQPLDIVIVDESSMMDLALMVELVTLIPATTQLILLGDHYQLPAVDPGQVFTDCVQRFSSQRPSEAELTTLSALTGYNLAQLINSDHLSNKHGQLGFQPLCVLRKTFRFTGDLKVAADQIKAGDSRAFRNHFWNESAQYNARSAVTWYDLGTNEKINYPAMVNAYTGYFELVAKRASLEELARQFESYQLLCSTLEGRLGVHFLNSFIEQRFYTYCFPKGKGLSELYHGKAILVMRNHPHLGIYNGDIGFVIEDKVTGNLNVHFQVANQETLIIAPARIKEWQTAYAMTVHKSQGSEYHQVGVVLADYTKELLSRALLYTALTRSKESCEIWADSGALNQAFGLAQTV